MRSSNPRAAPFPTLGCRPILPPLLNALLFYQGLMALSYGFASAVAAFLFLCVFSIYFSQKPSRNKK
jgi:hypothetical protein